MASMLASDVGHGSLDSHVGARQQSPEPPQQSSYSAQQQQGGWQALEASAADFGSKDTAYDGNQSGFQGADEGRYEGGETAVHAAVEQEEQEWFGAVYDRLGRADVSAGIG